MLKIYALSVICMIALFPTYAQKPPFKFGDVSMNELTMNRYDKDSSASAVILGDFGETAIRYNQSKGFQLFFERTKRIKILTKEGLGEANEHILLYHQTSGEEDISGLKSVTYNLENGNIVESKSSSDNIFREKYDDNRNVVKLIPPNVKKGSVVEITYLIKSDFLFNLQDWEFQSTIPIAWSEYRVWIPEFFRYDKYMQGYIKLDVSQTEPGSDGTGFRWVAQHVPAFKEEPFITTPKDYISKINFELALINHPDRPIEAVMGSWEKMADNFYKSEGFGGAIRGNGFLKKIVEEITTGLNSEEDKIKAIYTYVKDHVHWNQTTSLFLRLFSLRHPLTPSNLLS